METEITETFNFLRELIKGENDELYLTLDDDYLKSLLTHAKLIPINFISPVKDAYKILISAYKSMDAQKFFSSISSLQLLSASFNIDSMNMFYSVCTKGKMKEKEKAMIHNLLNRFKPLFKASPVKPATKPKQTQSKPKLFRTVATFIPLPPQKTFS
jgi:hypothetical protein